MKVNDPGYDIASAEAFLLDRFHHGPAVTADEMLALSVRLGRASYPRIFFHAWAYRIIEDGALGRVAAEAWTDPEYPEPALGRETWLEIFTEIGFCINGEPAARPEGPTRLYRGAPKARRRRMAWTSDWTIAAMFATGLMREPGTIWMTDAPPESLLAVITDGREESEYVIDTRGLRIVPGPATPPPSPATLSRGTSQGCTTR